MGCWLSCLSHRGQWDFCAKRDGNQTVPWLLLIFHEAETSPGAKSPCDGCCALGWVWFLSGRSLCSDHRILCAPHFGRVHKLAADSAVSCSCELADGLLKHLFCLPILASTETLSWLSHFSGSFFLPLSICSPIALLSFSAPNDRAVREWLMSTGWIERCNLGGSCPISGEFSAAKSPAGIIDLSVPID